MDNYSTFVSLAFHIFPRKLNEDIVFRYNRVSRWFHSYIPHAIVREADPKPSHYHHIT
jgi:hypothetical protein